MTDITDIVERLRELAKVQGWAGEAADEIERLRSNTNIIVARQKVRNDALEEAAKKATSFLVGDPVNGVPLRHPMAHEIADGIRALKEQK